MKIKLTKEIGSMGDETAIGKIHLMGAFDSTACGLAYEEYDYRGSKQPITCSTCIDIFNWCRNVSRVIKK